MKRFAWLVVSALLCAAAARAQSPAPAKAVLANLSWMAGRWIDDSDGNLSEEIWTAPSGDAMMGMWRFVEGGKTRICELLTIRVGVEGIEMRLRHFDPKLVAREEKETSVIMKLTSWKDRDATFEATPTSPSPGTSLRYRRPTDDTLLCTLEKAGKREEFSFKRAPQSQAP